MVYKYKAKNGLDFFIPGVGRSTNGILITYEKIESNAIELIDNPAIDAVQVAQSGAVIGVAPQATIMPQPIAQPIEAVVPILNNVEQES